MATRRRSTNLTDTGLPIPKQVNEDELTAKVKKHYSGKYDQYLEWVRQNPLYKKSIPDWLVCQKGGRGLAGFVEFKVCNNFLAKFVTPDGFNVIPQKDGRHRQLLFVKNFLSNSCIVNYNNKVQLVEEYVWVSDTQSINNLGASISPPSRLVLLSCYTLDNIKIKSIEAMLD